MVTKCGECRFWNSYGDVGQCRRRSPVISQPVTDFQKRGHWPETQSYEWCGDGQDKDQKGPPVRASDETGEYWLYSAAWDQYDAAYDAIQRGIAQYVPEGVILPKRMPDMTLRLELPRKP
jgi:hypothetical protein